MKRLAPLFGCTTALALLWSGCGTVTTPSLSEGAGGTVERGGKKTAVGGAVGGEDSRGGADDTSSNRTGGDAAGGKKGKGGSSGVGGAGGSSTSKPGSGGSKPGGAGGQTPQQAGGAAGGNTSTVSGPDGGKVVEGGGTAGSTSHVDYALPPPSQCHNQFYVPYDEGCRPGDASSTCGGKCQVINAGMESLASKPGADVTFMCQRDLLYSDEMLQAAVDDGNTDFNYAVVGHDIDPNGIDHDVASGGSTCCQCYQLVYVYPSPKNDRQVLANPNYGANEEPKSAIPLPKPLIVQSFNTAATATTFDVYMGAGGLGANNACAAVAGSTSQSGKYLYSSYPADGQPSQGGVKPVSLYSECKNATQWVTAETLSSDACQAKVEAACNKIESKIPGLTEVSRRSCLKANDPNADYHLNWAVYVAKVECPEHLTQVTGCKLAPSGLPAVKRNVTTAAQASADSDFYKKSSGGDMYETTTMEDCCRPSCANKDWVSGKGLKPDGLYNAFYSCDENGKPITEKQ